MKYTILVTGAAYGTQNASTAYLFCRALIDTHHQLYSVFFHCDGVLNANQMITPAVDEFSLVQAWKNLHQDHQVKLYVCHSAALRRGVVAEEKKYNKKIQDNLNLSIVFKFSGLMELAYSIKICDRIVQF